jgi:hypothetical protein
LSHLTSRKRRIFATDRYGFTQIGGDKIKTDIEISNGRPGIGAAVPSWIGERPGFQ